MGEHSLNCGAPICNGDNSSDWKRNVLWMPGEGICSYKTSKWQINQRKINKLVAQGKFRNMDTYFTAQSLGKITRITWATSGFKSKKVPSKHRESPYYNAFTSHPTTHP